MAERDEDAAEIGRRAAEAAFGTAQQSARRLGDEMRQAAASLVHDQKAQVADTVQGFAHAFRRTAAALKQEANPVAARCADQMAGGLDRVATALAERQFPDLLSEAEALARRQPALFVAGAMALGFVAARLLSAPPSPAPRRPRDDARQEEPKPALASAGAARW